MTTNIDSLPAGRELDALVAEKVMGWKAGKGWFDSQRPDRWHDADGNPLDDKHATWEGDGGGDFYYPDTAWSPSTDIAAAWEVFAKIPGIGEYGVAIERDPDGSYAVIRQDSVYVYISGGGGAPEFETLAQGNTAPLAICRAALRTVGV